MKLCPKGAEGASYSLLTTFNNVAGICGQNVAMLIAEIWYERIDITDPIDDMVGMSPMRALDKEILKDYGNYN